MTLARSGRDGVDAPNPPADAVPRPGRVELGWMDGWRQEISLDTPTVVATPDGWVLIARPDSTTPKCAEEWPKRPWLSCCATPGHEHPHIPGARGILVVSVQRTHRFEPGYQRMVRAQRDEEQWDEGQYQEPDFGRDVY